MSDIQILVGSVTGTAEGVADVLAETARAKGQKAEINSDFQAGDLVRDPDEALLVCTANTGAGDIPSNLQPLLVHLLTDYPAIAGKRFGLVNLGDSSYPTFGEAGQQLEEALEDLGAQRLGDSLLLDASEGLDPEDEAQTWLHHWLELL